MENYVVHPAFNLGGQELAGIWVAKFEMSMEGHTQYIQAEDNAWTMNITYTNDTWLPAPENVERNIEINETNREEYRAVSKPGVSPWRNISIGNMFVNGLNYDTNTLNAPNLDSHLMKNIEWGAVAYLTESKYGRNGTEIAQNTAVYITEAGGTPTSTTGNFTGIYDLSGGAWEYVAAYLNGDTNENGYKLRMGEAKYKEVYDAGTTTDYGKIDGKINYGDAMYETSSSCAINRSGNTTASWHGDFSEYVCSTYPFVGRGGGYSNTGTMNGIFYFGSYRAGQPNVEYGWRVVLAGEQGEAQNTAPNVTITTNPNKNVMSTTENKRVTITITDNQHDRCDVIIQHYYKSLASDEWELAEPTDQRVVNGNETYSLNADAYLMGYHRIQVVAKDEHNASLGWQDVEFKILKAESGYKYVYYLGTTDTSSWLSGTDKGSVSVSHTTGMHLTTASTDSSDNGCVAWVRI